MVDPLGEEGALVADGDVHEVAQDPGVFNRGSQEGLDSEFAIAVSDHDPERGGHGLEAGAEEAGDAGNGLEAVDPILGQDHT